MRPLAPSAYKEYSPKSCSTQQQKRTEPERNGNREKRNQRDGKKKKIVYAMAVLDADEAGTPSAAATSGGTPAAACTSESRPSSATAAADEDSSLSDSARTRTAGEPAYSVAGGMTVPGATTEPEQESAKGSRASASAHERIAVSVSQQGTRSSI